MVVSDYINVSDSRGRSMGVCVSIDNVSYGRVPVYGFLGQLDNCSRWDELRWVRALH